MANEEIKFRKRIRQRNDNTAIHRTGLLDASNTSEDIKLDIVAQRFTVEVPAGLTVNITASLDGITFFIPSASFTGLTGGRASYGAGASDHLVKVLRFTRTLGSGQVVVVGV